MCVDSRARPDVAASPSPRLQGRPPLLSSAAHYITKVVELHCWVGGESWGSKREKKKVEGVRGRREEGGGRRGGKGRGLSDRARIIRSTSRNLGTSQSLTSPKAMSDALLVSFVPCQLESACVYDNHPASQRPQQPPAPELLAER
eukprot:756695-Hanusia_phi.AAC.2